jgi:hypothetical protein
MTGSLPLSRLTRFVLVLAGLALVTVPLQGATKKRKPATPPPPAPEEVPATPVMDENSHDRHSLKEVHQETDSSGAHSYWFGKGDEFSGKDSPDIKEHGLDIEARFNFDPKASADSTLISQGNDQLGWAVHIVHGKPAITINYEGLSTTLRADEPLPAGPVVLRALLGLDGTLGIGAVGSTKPGHGYAPMIGGFPSQPEEGPAIGKNTGALSKETFPDNTAYDGELTFIRLSVLPAKPVGVTAKK